MAPKGRKSIRGAVGLDDPFRFPAHRLKRVLGAAKDPIVHVVRKHWIALVFPVTIVVVGSGLTLTHVQPRLWLALSASGLIGLSLRKRRWSEAQAGILAGLGLVLLVLIPKGEAATVLGVVVPGAPTVAIRVVGVAVLLVYLAVVTARWWFEILVLTDTSLWKLSGVLTTASRKVRLSESHVQNVRQSVLETLLNCGTLDFDVAGASGKRLLYFGPIRFPFAMFAQIELQRALTQVQGRARKAEGQFRMDPQARVPPGLPEMIYDVFISHASEDKEEVATPLAHLLVERGLDVWYDDFALTVGDSLRRSIDRGLAGSRFGVIVLSPDFFRKQWPQAELAGLAAKERAAGEKVMLPIWHRLTKDDLLTSSPTLADLKALNTAVMTMAEIADQIATVARA